MLPVPCQLPVATSGLAEGAQFQIQKAYDLAPLFSGWGTIDAARFVPALARSGGQD